MLDRRLYFVIPNEAQAVQVVADLEAAGANRQYIHAIAGKGAMLTQLPPANERQRRDDVWHLERVGWAGNLVLFGLALIGLIASMAWGFPVGSVLSATLMALTFVAGTLFAIRVPDTHLDEFRGALSHSEILLMVDVPRQRVAEIEEIIHRRHPEAMLGGTGWTIEAMHI
jgi:hypothetical protein